MRVRQYASPVRLLHQRKTDNVKLGPCIVFSTMTGAALSHNKILKTRGPLERLFPGSSSACILDFLMLAAQKDQYYSESEIARYSGVALKNTKAAISNLQETGLIREEAVVPVVIAGRRRKSKVYAFSNAEDSLSKALANLVLELTNRKVAMASEHAVVKHTGPGGAGSAVDELIDAGIIKISGGKPDNDE